MPAISVCSGFDIRGLPVGLQIAPPAFREADLFRLAHAYEARQDWKNARAKL
ncbi:MAG: hypothetical protein ACRBM6_04960 [Geminicoccales bacterium]